MKKIKCAINPEDFIKVQGDRWAEEGYCSIDLRADSGRIILSPDKIRKLRKQLKRALIEIEGKPDDSMGKTEYKPGDSVYLVEGDDEGDDYDTSPFVYDINLSNPVKLIKRLESGKWELKYETYSGGITTGYAYEKSFGHRA